MPEIWNNDLAVVCFVALLALIIGLVLKAGLPALMDRGQQRGEMWKSRIPFPIQDALNQLYTVTERRGHHEYRLDDDDTECPICLSSFSRRSNDMSSRRDTEIDLEAGLETHETAKTITVDASKRNKTPVLQPMDTEILRINRCGHTFHSRCLVTWFLKSKHDCPICRTAYYPPSGAAGAGN
ncbi:hypothetical protein F4801DRAFT_605001 [Xylaria longipes]|nr:hypothetical protein F4801DRAFT_605001 [Xylaria longipes]